MTGDRLTVAETIDLILDGIDRAEGDNEGGWWETSTGAEFGAERKAALKAALDGVEALLEAARFQIEVAPQGTTSRLADALARFPATSPAKEQA